LERVCFSCKTSKPLVDFARDRARDKDGTEGRTRNCKECRRVSFKDWASKNKDRIASHNKANKELRKAYYADPDRKRKYRGDWLLRTYGISHEKYDEMLAAQGGVCAICSQPERSARNRHLAVDHCHKTGKVRGLLCTNCNRALGLFSESPAVLSFAINYIERNK
jgi:hypothetical protein